MKMKVRYLKPETDIVKVQVDRILTETSWTSGNGDNFTIIEGNPDNPTEDPYGDNNAKGMYGGVSDFNLWAE